VRGNHRFIAKELAGRTTVRSFASALALGALLGSALTLCTRQMDASLLWIAIRLAVSVMLLAVLNPVQVQDLSLGTWSLPRLPELGYGGAQGKRD
jgi:hypothetical protein